MTEATVAARSGIVIRRGLVVATVSLVGVVAAATAASAAEPNAGETYEVTFETERVDDRIDDGVLTVESGDTLSLIAADVGLDDTQGWRVLFDANDQIDDPDLIMPGQEFEVPEEGDELERREVPAGAAAAGGSPESTEDAPAEDSGADTGSTEDAPAEGSGSDQAESSGSSEPESAPAPAETETTASGSVWDRLAECESNGDWSINTGNGYYGGLQFHPQTWAAHGGHEYAPNAHEATREQEIVIAERVLESQGWGAWPACSSQLGLR